MIAKLKPNVLVIALLSSALTGFGMYMLLTLLATETPGPGHDALITVFALLVGGGIVNLVNLAAQVATDPAPPAYPAKELPELVRAICDVMRRDDANTDSP